ncbi:hypothetical protein D3C87_485930 [compost metagenome]
MICNDCGLPFDESDLSQVFEHEHRGLTFINENVKSKKVINDATDIYPGCSRQFASGVHTWINKGQDYDQRLLYQHSEDFRRGYYQAQDELEDNYKMNR